MVGVILSLFVILNLRNGLALANMTGNTQLGVIGALLILSVLVPNLVSSARARLARRTAERRAARAGSTSETISG
jgi:rhamnose transport system permease protein